MSPILVFIDFDGVIHPIRGSSRSVMDPLGDWRKGDWGHVKSLASVLADFPETRAVVSSHWRLFYPLEDLARMLAPIRVFDATGPDGYTRYREIADYMIGCVTPWLAIDDNDEMWPDDERWRLVLCKPWLGLDEESRLQELRQKLDIVRRAESLGQVQREMAEAFPTGVDRS